MTEYGLYIGQNKQLFERYKQLQDSPEYDNLDAPQKKAVDNSVDYFKRAGVAISEEDKPRFQQISQRLSELSNTYSNNILDAKKAWFKHITNVRRLDGVPENALGVLEQAAKDRGLEGYVITLDAPNFLPVLDYCSNRSLRKEVVFANATKASEIGPHGGQWDNGPLMNEIMELRKEKVAMLGFEDYASYSIDAKMAETTTEVLDFMNDIVNKSRQKGLDDVTELKQFAKDKLGLDKVERWDFAYCITKLMEEKYQISSEEMRPYFPLETVLGGFFDLLSKLYGLEFRSRRTETWHDDVLFYDIYLNDEHIAGFYLDPFARSDKRGGAWMNDPITRFKQSDGTLQLPIAYLCCNFAPPTDTTPALLTHDDVQTLFHEFGHGLHHMLTQIDVLDVSGINGVEWDAVELPSQFMENWCWDKETMGLISYHYKTGKSLPDDLLDKMLAAKNFMSGYYTLRQMEMSLFDFRIHMEYDNSNIYDILKDTRNAVSVIKYPKFDRMPNSFSHIFGGGYAAGYYSYKWAEVLSADAFSLFEENGIFDKATGESFKKNILEMGGSRKAMESFVAFRGRKPSVDALLRHNGIIE